MGSAFHQLCPRYSGTLTPAAPTAIKLWDTFTFYGRVLAGGCCWDMNVKKKFVIQLKVDVT